MPNLSGLNFQTVNVQSSLGNRSLLNFQNISVFGSLSNKSLLNFQNIEVIPSGDGDVPLNFQNIEVIPNESFIFSSQEQSESEDHYWAEISSEIPDGMVFMSNGSFLWTTNTKGRQVIDLNIYKNGTFITTGNITVDVE